MAAVLPALAQTPTLRIARIENIPDQAVGAELLRTVYRRAGIGIEFVDMPAKRALAESSEGRVDGEVQRIRAVGEQYPTLLAVPVPINFIEPAAFTTRLEFAVAGWQSLRPYSLAIVRGVGSSERGTQGMPRVEAVASMDQLMQMVASGRVEVGVNDRFSGLLVLRRLGLDKLVHPLAPPLERIELFHFVHTRHRELIPRLEEQLRTMQASGELERLRAAISARLLGEAAR